MIIFGATGDLTRRKLIPALCNLASAKLLTDHFAIIGFARKEFTTEQFRNELTEGVKELAASTVSSDVWKWIRGRLYCVRGDSEDPSAYERLKEQIAQSEKRYDTQGNALFYLAVPPQFFGKIIEQLGAAGLMKESRESWRRVVIEKPFGRDLQSARALNAQIRQVIDERQIHRIDHYLGKETVQNIIIFRFANGLFEPIWNRRYIDQVQITAAGRDGVGSRGGYYDTAGALRDMVPNHLFQLISLMGMEPPVSFDPNAVRDEQAKLLHSLQRPKPEEVLTLAVRGQYAKGQLDGKPVPGYRDEPNVGSDSNTETFVALKLVIDNWRWADVPFYLRTGKRLAKRVTEIAIHFKRAPFQLFRGTPVACLQSNQLIVHIHPDEGMSLCFGAKVPGPIMRLGAVEMDFQYADYFGTIPSTGYERLIYDCMIGDATLFQRADMVEAGWAVVTPVLDVWQALPPRDFPNYSPGSWGPRQADELLARNGHQWRTIE
ncbi:MAG TPA: glucose-6-phosphate dehydrogenase [Verrucomicrobiae bacterium]|nr:glucose-6-phosphate dehydrogenase [Verrucomicrobiae bacterium]